MDDIVVTGFGCMTPCGKTVPALWDCLLEGRSGISTVTRFDTSEFDVHFAGEIKDFDPKAYGISAKEARRLDRFAQYGLAAAREALTQADLPNETCDPDRVGVVIGSGIGGISSTEHQMDVLRKRGPSRVSPLLVPGGTPDVGSNQIALEFGFKGPSFAVSTACSSGSDAIIAAVRCLLDGSADIMVAGGAEAPVSELSLSTFANLGAMSRQQGDPTRVSRPFDLHRTGFIVGEGAGVLVLETRAGAERRGVPAIARLAGYGQSTDAFHKTAPDPGGEGAAKAIGQAMRQAGVSPEEVGYVNAHGTGTLQNDPMETRALKTVLGAHAKKVPVSSTKSMTGHLIGAGGAVEAIVAIQALLHQHVPPTINYETPDPECDLFYVPNQAIDAQVEVAISNSFAFGGHNAALVFCRPEYRR
jgi:3-oxoacyl-[acyl-carrier-protein] synthase II